jgi:hypothetical protein
MKGQRIHSWVIVQKYVVREKYQTKHPIIANIKGIVEKRPEQSALQRSSFTFKPCCSRGVGEQPYSVFPSPSPWHRAFYRFRFR